MAENIDPSLTGAAFDLASAGYLPMPDPLEKKREETIGSDRTSLRQAAEQRRPANEPIVKRQYTNREGEPVSASEAITLARAARDYADVVAAEKHAEDSEDSKAIAEHVDALRAEAL